VLWEKKMHFAIIATIFLVALITGLSLCYANERWALHLPGEAFVIVPFFGAILACLNGAVLDAGFQLPVLVVVSGMVLGPPLEAVILVLGVKAITKLGKFLQQLGREARENAADRE
jgi:hypothetical protein